MIKLNTAPKIFQNTGLILVCLQLLLFVFALYPFQFGTWFNTEPQMVAIFSFAMIGSLWLSLGIIKNWLVIEKPMHPLVYCLCAWAAWQFLSLPFADNAMRSWIGISQTGEGGGLYVAFVILVFVIMPLWTIATYRKILLAVGVFSLSLMLYLHFNPRLICPIYDNYIESNTATPANWPDYLPIIAGWLWIAYATAKDIRTPASHFWMMALFVLAIVIGENTAVKLIIRPLFISLNITILVLLVIKKTKLKNYKVAKLFYKIMSVGKFWKSLAIIGLCIPLAWIFIAQNPNIYLGAKRTSAGNAMASRAFFNQVAMDAITNEPTRLIAGNGWGSFGEDLFKYGMIKGARSFENGADKENSRWISDRAFHVHSQPIQVLLSLGLIGFILFMLLPILAVWHIRRNLFWWCAPIFLGLQAVSFFWFPLPQNIPFQAMAFAAIATSRKQAVDHIQKIPSSLGIITLLIGICFFFSANTQIQSIKYGERLVNLMQESPNQKDMVEWLASDTKLGGDRFAEGVYYYANEFTARSDAGKITPFERDWYRNFLEAAHELATAPNASVYMQKLEFELDLMPFRLANPSLLDELQPMIKEHILETVVRISKSAPKREDLIAPFLLNLYNFADNDAKKAQEILEKIIAVAPNHRSALWLLGSIYEKFDDKDKIAHGKAMKKQAVKLGVERVFPVTNAELCNINTDY